MRARCKEETSLKADALNLIGVYDFQRMNQVIIAYHVVAARGEISLSPELAEYKLFYAGRRCVAGRAGTGYALADWLRSLAGMNPQFIDCHRAT